MCLFYYIRKLKTTRVSEMIVVYAAVCILQLMSGTVRIGDGGVMSMKRRGRPRLVKTDKEEVPQVGFISLLFDNPVNDEKTN